MKIRDDISSIDGICPNEDDLSGVDDGKRISNNNLADLVVKDFVASFVSLVKMN